jgi:hypothetical protein
MFYVKDVYKYAKEYVMVEIKAADRIIFNHLRGMKRDEAVIKIYKTKDEPNIKGLIKQKEESIERHKQRINYYQNKIKILKLIPIKRHRTFISILKILNKNIIREVLRGGKYIFPLGIGKLYILVGDKYYTANSINWPKSMAIINNIAKNVAPDIYEDFRNKKIQQFEYMQLMKQHLYPVPGKPRWVVTDDETTAWWIVFKKGNNPNHNKYFFKLKPTHYVKLKDKTLSMLKKYFDTAEDVINSNDLGFREKVHVLRLFFNEQKLKYNDISSDKW